MPGARARGRSRAVSSCRAVSAGSNGCWTAPELLPGRARADLGLLGQRHLRARLRQERGGAHADDPAADDGDVHQPSTSGRSAATSASRPGDQAERLAAQLLDGTAGLAHEQAARPPSPRRSGRARSRRRAAPPRATRGRARPSRRGGCRAPPAAGAGRPPPARRATPRRSRSPWRRAPRPSGGASRTLIARPSSVAPPPRSRREQLVAVRVVHDAGQAALAVLQRDAHATSADSRRGTRPCRRAGRTPTGARSRRLARALLGQQPVVRALAREACRGSAPPRRGPRRRPGRSPSTSIRVRAQARRTAP